MSAPAARPMILIVDGIVIDGWLLAEPVQPAEPEDAVRACRW